MLSNIIYFIIDFRSEHLDLIHSMINAPNLETILGIVVAVIPN